MSISEPSQPSPLAHRTSRPGAVGPGDLLASRYLLGTALGEGGMAVVYRATDEHTGEPCAIKVLHAELGARPEIRELFAKEACIGEVIGPCPNIAKVLDAGVDIASSAPFIAMELLEGETLEEALTRGPLPRHESRRLLEELGFALDRAHQAGIVHRDLKPSNLFLARTGDGTPQLKIMDFGIAKLIEAGAVRTATQIGTPAYTAPEQLGGTTRRLAAKQGIVIARGVSPATDVWALGLIAYEMFTGEPPGHYWRFETLAELPVTIAFEDLALASERAGARSSLLPHGFDGWFARCLDKDAEARWPSAGEAVRALLSLEGGSTASVAPKPPPPDGAVLTVKAPPHRGASDGADGGVAPNADVLLVPSRAHRRFVGGVTLVASLLCLAAFVAVKLAPRPESLRLAAACGVEPPPSEGGSERRAWARGAARASCVAPDCDAAACVALAELLESNSPGGTSHLARAVQAKAPHSNELNQYNEDLVRALLERTCALHGAALEPSRGVLGCVGLGHRRHAAGELDAARSHFEAACNGGVASGCVALGGTMLEPTTRGGPSEKRALELFERGCEAGELEGCVRLGRLLEVGRGGWQPDETRAATLFKRACDGGTLSGCVSLALQLEGGRGGLTRDAVAASELQSRACDGGEPDGCAHLARHFAEAAAGRERDERHAFTLNRRACDRWSPRGCAQLGAMYLSGAGGLSPDRVEAQRLFRRACDAADASGCVALAKLALSREPPDSDEAVVILERSCEAVPGISCTELGSILRRKHLAGNDDPAKAAVAFERGCDAGEPRACTELADLVYVGVEGFPRDPDRSARLNERACRDGDEVGCARLAVLAALGEGVTRDRERALELYRGACDSPSDENRTRCDELSRLLDGASFPRAHRTERPATASRAPR